MVYPFGTGGQLPSSEGIGKGTFADAYDKARGTNLCFSWMLVDIDDDGNNIKKMIWHDGNRKFVDAIGSTINGQKNGITIEMSDSGTLYVYKPSTSSTTYVTFQLAEGENNISIDEIKAAGVAAGWGSDYDGTIIGLLSVSAANKVLGFDFGNITFQYKNKNSGFPNFCNFTNAEYIKRAKIDYKSNSGYSFNTIFQQLTHLSYLELSGIFDGDLWRCFENYTTMAVSRIYWNLKGLLLGTGTKKITKSFISMVSATLDIRDFDTSGVEQIYNDSFNLGSTGIAIIGNFSTEGINTSLAQSKPSFKTLVCTTDEPPFYCGSEEGDTPPIDWLTNTTTIYIPNKDVDVDGTPTPLIEVYAAASGWSAHASKMAVYTDEISNLVGEL